MIEVGINVPNATIMMIEGAERFGRSITSVSRKSKARKEQSYCLLFTSKLSQQK